jgi:hypothetical protein
MTQTSAERLPGGRAETPVQIPPRGWWQVVKRAFQEGNADNVRCSPAPTALVPRT